MSEPLDELAEAWEHKTPGPWRNRVVSGVMVETYCVVAFNEPVVLGVNGEDGRFIALAGTHVGSLMERLRAAETVCEAADRLHGYHVRHAYPVWRFPDDLVALRDGLDAWRQLRAEP